jgi:hypothetical protein
MVLSRDFAAELRLGVPSAWFGDVYPLRDVKRSIPGSRFGTRAGVRSAVSTAPAADEKDAPTGAPSALAPLPPFVEKKHRRSTSDFLGFRPRRFQA